MYFLFVSIICFAFAQVSVKEVTEKGFKLQIEAQKLNGERIFWVAQSTEDTMSVKEILNAHLTKKCAGRATMKQILARSEIENSCKLSAGQAYRLDCVILRGEEYEMISKDFKVNIPRRRLLSTPSQSSDSSASSSQEVDSPSAPTNAAGIPLVIVQTGPESIREEWALLSGKLRQNNPGFEYQYFNDAAAQKFIDEHYPNSDLQKAYGLVRPVMKSDLFRLAFIAQNGGFYFDMDMDIKKSITSLTYHQAVFPKEWKQNDQQFMIRHKYFPRDEEEKWQLGNYAFGAVKNHELINDAIIEATKRILSFSGTSYSDQDVLITTGPYMLTEVYHSGRRHGKYQNVELLQGGNDTPRKHRTYGTNDWHKFGEFGEHTITHSWITSRRTLNDEYYNEYGFEPTVAPTQVDTTSTSETTTTTTTVISKDSDSTFAGFDLSSGGGLSLFILTIVLVILLLFTVIAGPYLYRQYYQLLGSTTVSATSPKANAKLEALSSFMSDSQIDIAPPKKTDGTMYAEPVE